MVLQYVEYIIIICFIYINILIIKWDFKKNIIKNKFLWFLWCLFLISVMSYTILWQDISYIHLYSFINIFSVFITSFLLSTFRVWWAWDAKYFFILYLFVWYISPLIYIGNIVVTTFILLLLLFIKNIIFVNKNWIWLWYIISWDIKRWKNNIINKFQKSYILWVIWLLNIINQFFLFFLLIKLIRQLFFIVSPLQNITWIPNYLNPYFTVLLIFIVAIILIRKYLYLGKNIIWRKLWIAQMEMTTLFNLFLLVLTSILLAFIYTDPSIFLSEMYQILTIYFLIHLSIRCILYIYKKCFIEMEKSIIHINDLKYGDYIDKAWMKWRIMPLLKDKKIKHRISLHTQSPQDIKEIRKLVKLHYKKEPYVNIIDSFPYSPVIFWGFILTYIYNNSYLLTVIEYIKNIIL